MSQYAIETKEKQNFQDIFLMPFPFFNILELVFENNLTIFQV